MSEISDALKIGTTALVLEVIEGGGLHDRMSIEDPIRAIREISEDPSLKRRVRLESGQELTALEIQREYLECCQEFFVREGITPGVREMLDLWEKTLTELSGGEDETLGREIDWVIKQRLLERYRERKHGVLEDPAMAMMDIQYHDVHEERGLYNVLAREGYVDRIALDTEILAAMDRPPQTTRAKLRGEHIREAMVQHRSYTVDWTYMRLNDPPQETLHWSDPFSAQEIS